MIKLIFAGIKRRRKEIRYVSVVTFAAVLFLCGITLFQSIMNKYVVQKNLDTYGNWIVSTIGKNLSHPYFLLDSSCTVGASLMEEETWIENGIMVGIAAEDFDLVDGSNFYEGRMPETENEIVMDTISLAKLGYSYDLGQMVSVNYRTSEGLIAEKEYELVGIIKCFAQIWKVDGDYPLPNCFVSSEEFEKNYKQNSYTVYFYQLDPKYSDIDTKEFGYQFVDADEEGLTIFNSYVYENQLWGTSDLYQKVTFALMVISALAISYLMIAYTGKRRGVYYKYRCIGASKSQVRRIILTECIYATLPEIVLGIALSYLAAFGISKYISISKEMTDFYELDAELFAGQILATVGVVLVAVLVTQFSISDKRLSGNTGTVKPSKYKKLRRIAMRTKKPEKTIFKRQNALRPIQNLVSALFSMIVCAILVFCINRIVESYSDTEFVLRVNNDFNMNASVNHTFEVIDQDPNDGISNEKHLFSMYDMYTGADEILLEQIQMCPGVDTVGYIIQDELHYFTWEGMEDSKLMKKLKEAQECGTPVEYEMKMLFYEDLSDIKEQVEVWGDSQNIDWDKFEAGEQVILIVNAYNFETGEKLEDTLQLGDMITIKNALTDAVNTSVEIALLREFNERELHNEIYTSTYKMLGSVAFAEKIAASEGQELRANNIQIMYNQNASYESSDKQLTRLAKDNDLDFSSFAEFRRIFKQQLLQDIAIYGAVFLMIATIYIVIQRSFLASKNKYWQTRFVLLKQIGMEDDQYFKMAFKEECKSYLWLFLGLIPGWYLSACALFEIYGTLEGEQSVVWYFLFHRIDHKIYIGMALLLYLVVVAGSANVIRKCIWENGKTKQNQPENGK